MENQVSVNDFTILSNVAFVSSDGHYSLDNEVIVFDPDKLSAKQASTLDSLPDSDRFDYIEALLNDRPLNEWEA